MTASVKGVCGSVIKLTEKFNFSNGTGLRCFVIDYSEAKQLIFGSFMALIGSYTTIQ